MHVFGNKPYLLGLVLKGLFFNSMGVRYRLTPVSYLLPLPESLSTRVPTGIGYTHVLTGIGYTHVLIGIGYTHVPTNIDETTINEVDSTIESMVAQ